LAKYAAAGGSLLWEKRYKILASLAADYGTAAAALTVDSGGSVIVTEPAFSNESPGGGLWTANSDYYTAKYAAEDGDLLWEKRYNGPAYHESSPGAVVMDANGNVVVTATSENDFYTAKYGASNGALLWEKRGPGQVTQVTVDDSGNVLVTGISYDGSGSQNHYYTAKYAADGGLLWERRAPGGGAQVALDASGNVLVTGESFKGTTSSFYTAKYAAVDGALLWEKSYNESARISNLAGGSHSLALGLNGKVAITGRSILKTTGAEDVLTVVYREGLSAVAIEPVPSGVRLSYTGTAGQSYSIQRAPAVSGPWSTLATPTAPLNGLIEYFDTAPPSDAAFYRTSAP